MKKLTIVLPLILSFALLLSFGFAKPVSAASALADVEYPFEPGTVWYVNGGYETSWGHNDSNGEKYAFDLVRDSMGDTHGTTANSKILAVADGQLGAAYDINRNSVYAGKGIRLTLDDGSVFEYDHIHNIVRENQRINKGEQIASIWNGKPGGVNHLHFNRIVSAPFNFNSFWNYPVGGPSSGNGTWSGTKIQVTNPCFSPILPGCGSATAVTGVSFQNNPSIASLNSKLFVGFKSADASNKLYITNKSISSDSWLRPAKAYDGLTFQGSPAVAKFNSRVYMAFRANDASGSLYVTSSTDGINWQTPATKIPGVVFQGDPTMTAFNGKLYIAFRSFDSGNTVYMINSSNGVNWNAAKHLSGFKLQNSPALIVFKNKLLIAFRANDSSNSLYMASSSDASNWPASATKVQGISLSEGPALTVSGGKLVLAFKSNDASNTLYVASSLDAVNWGSAIQYKNIKLNSRPAMVTVTSPTTGSTIIFMVFRANDSSNLLYTTMSPNNGLSWIAY